MKSYGTKQPIEISPIAPITNESNCLTSEIALLFLSPGAPFVLIYVILCWWLSTLTPLNIRPMPGEFLDDGADTLTFIKDASNDLPWLDHETVTYNQLIMFSFGIPPLILLPVIKITSISGDLRAAVYGFSCSMATTNLVTNFAKNYVGRLRPFFYQRCGFDYQDFTCRLGAPESDYIRQSFPSGHASLSMCSFLFCSLFLLGKINISQTNSSGNNNHLFDISLGRYGKLRTTPFLSLLATIPVWFSFWICTTRIHDNWHHPSDALAGVVIGGFISFFFYHLGYGSIYDHDSSIPLVSALRTTMSASSRRSQSEQSSSETSLLI
mmetsp:Transcript_52919/g.67859  ORF Transcript_52919/g.67859 Transcript_52919/m.67859 type:complete len:324 (-) Transcript_52919:18-989(-)